MKGTISYNKYGYYVTESMMAAVVGNNWTTSYNRGEATFKNGGLRDIYGNQQGTEDTLDDEATYLRTALDDAELHFNSQDGKYWFYVTTSNINALTTFRPSSDYVKLWIRRNAWVSKPTITVYRYPVDIPLDATASTYLNYIKEKPNRVSDGTATRNVEVYVNETLVYTAANIKHIDNTINSSDLNVSTKTGYVLDRIGVSGSTYKVYLRSAKYYIDFNGNGSTGGSMSRETLYYGISKTLAANAFSRTGYSFAGWNTAADGSGTSYTDGQSVSNLSSTEGDIITLYAQWTAHHYTIKFNANGGSGSMSDLAMIYGTAKKLTANAFEKKKTVTFDAAGGTCTPSSAPSLFPFTGWSDNNGHSYTDTQSVTDLNPSDGGEVTLYAQWGTQQAVTLPTPTREGYAFTGWYTAASGGSRIGKGGDSYTPSEDVTVYAHWQGFGFVLCETGLEGDDSAVFKVTIGSRTYRLTLNAATPSVSFIDIPGGTSISVAQQVWNWAYDVTPPASESVTMGTEALTLMYRYSPKASAAMHAEAHNKME